MQHFQRIAIFQANWPLQVHTFNCAITLAKANFQVDIFLYKTFHSFDIVDLRELDQYNNIKVYNIGNNISKKKLFSAKSRKYLKSNFEPLLSQYMRVRSFFKDIYYYLIRRRASVLLPGWVLQNTINLMKDKFYHALIGVEKNGLIWAGQIAECFNVPFIYYSLELYTDDYFSKYIIKSFYFKKLRATEIKYHKKAHATIIQDVERAKVLFQANQIPMTGAVIFYVPVSLLGKSIKANSNFVYNLSEKNIKDRKIILHFGKINDNILFKLVESAQQFPDNCILLLHGDINAQIISKIDDIDINKRVLISTKMLHYKEIWKVIKSADIALSLYLPFTDNDRLTVFSSEKMARYAKCGIPFISYNYPCYVNFANEDHSGVVIQTLNELPEAINEILTSYKYFQKNAYKTFYKYYDFEHNFNKVIRYLKMGI